MRLLVLIPDGVGYHKRHRGRGAFVKYARHRKIETTVYKLFSSVRRVDGDVPSIYVHAWIPEHHRDGIAENDPGWVGDGVMVCRAPVRDNRTTLAAFLASGDSEWDLRGKAA